MLSSVRATVAESGVVSRVTLRAPAGLVAVPVRHRSCGLIGLPNVGKSTLFNALTKTQQAEAENYPFCTIEPNTARVEVPDARIEKLASLEGSERCIKTQIEFTDIAGLIKGASEGQGLGNMFLSHIRETSVLLQVVRCFENESVIHVEEGDIDPIRDIAILETELVLADLQSVEKRLGNKQHLRKLPNAEQVRKLLHDARDLLSDGVPLRSGDWSPDQLALLPSLQMLTLQPMMYICNVDEGDASDGNALVRAVESYVEESDTPSRVLTVSASLEAEVATLESEEAQLEYLGECGLSETGLARLIRESAGLLGLCTFYTVGKQEARAWNIKRGMTAPQAASVIHTDMQRGFIRAETTAYEEFVRAKEEGVSPRSRLEGKDYVVKDGDVMHFRFNV